MAVSGEDLKKWAQGRLSNSATDEELDGDDEAPEDGPEEEGEDTPEGDRNALWAGEYEGDLAELSVEEAEELLGWLQEHEPEIADAVLGLAAAAADEDEQMLEHATSELGGAIQNLNPEYPELTDQQRDAAARYIADEIATFGHPAKDSPEWKQAVAIGLSKARQE